MSDLGRAIAWAKGHSGDGYTVHAGLMEAGKRLWMELATDSLQAKAEEALVQLGEFGDLTDGEVGMMAEKLKAAKRTLESLELQAKRHGKTARELKGEGPHRHIHNTFPPC